MSSSLWPPTYTQAKLVDGGKVVHVVNLMPDGSSGPCTQFWSSKFKISVDFEPSSLSVSPPIIIIYSVDPSSGCMAQLEWQSLAVSNDGPVVQLSSLLSKIKVLLDLFWN